MYDYSGPSQENLRKMLGYFNRRHNPKSAPPSKRANDVTNRSKAIDRFFIATAMIEYFANDSDATFWAESVSREFRRRCLSLGVAEEVLFDLESYAMNYNLPY